MKVLIVTMVDDLHALYVKFALEAIGHQCEIWLTTDMPKRQAHSFRISNQTFSWQAYGDDLTIKDDNFDIIWFRRYRMPENQDYLHPDDAENAHKESVAFFRSWWSVIGKNAIWINDPISAREADKKLYQLSIAKALNFPIPDTLMSNHPKSIKSFISAYPKGEVIYKSFNPLSWATESGVKAAYSRPIDLTDLPDDKYCQAAPSILQSKIDKAYELRVTYMGGKIIAARLNASLDPRGKNDWRAMPAHDIGLEPYELPESTILFIHRFMERMGLLFGCLDFIVTPEGQTVFLEVNEQGQFLWKEELCPSMTMLNEFVHFLIRQHTGEDIISNSHVLHMTDFQQEVTALNNQLVNKRGGTASLYKQHNKVSKATAGAA